MIDNGTPISTLIRRREAAPLMDDIARIRDAFNPDRIARTFSPLLADAASREARLRRFAEPLENQGEREGARMIPADESGDGF